VSGNGNGNGHTTPTITSYPLTDIGNAERLVAQAGESMRMVPVWNRWLVYQSGRWVPDETKQVERFAKDSVRAFYEAAKEESDTAWKERLMKHARASESNGRVHALLVGARAEPGIAIGHASLDASPWLLNVANGTLDLQTGQLRGHERADLLTKLAPVTYLDDARCPKWLDFLDRIMAGRSEMIGFLQRAIGYSLTGSTQEQCLFFLHGSGANGKSTFLEVLRKLLGDYAVQADFATFLDKKFAGVGNDIARLVGARLVSSSEVGEGKRLNESLIKTLTGTDTIAARFLYAEAFEFAPSFKIWLAANHKPVIRGTDGAIWRRIRLIPFTVEIPEGERDSQLPATLQAELPGILRWAVEGCQLWLEDSLRPPQDVLIATAEYRKESDVLGAFLTECCYVPQPAPPASQAENADGLGEMRTVCGPLAPQPSAPAKALYQAYSTWAESGGERRMTQTAFGKALTERGFTREKVGHANTYWWLGLSLLPPSRDNDADGADGFSSINTRARAQEGELRNTAQTVRTVRSENNYDNDREQELDL
jgi:putative DNA primase/helicase